MPTKIKLSMSLALAAAALVSLPSAAPAKPTQIDSYCSPSGDICQEIIRTKKTHQIKFVLSSFTPAVQGEYTLCVKGNGKECKDFVLEQTDDGVYSDKVNWGKEFLDDYGSYLVKWKYMGERLGKKLRFEIAVQPPDRR